MITLTTDQARLLRVALGLPSILVPAAGYLLMSSSSGLRAALVTSALAVPAATYLITVRSAIGSLYFGLGIFIFSVLPWLVVATDQSGTDTGGGFFIAGGSATALVLAISAAAVDRVLRSGEARDEHAEISPPAKRTIAPTRTAPPSASLRNDGEALASFVLGILGLIALPVLLSVPAVILGRRSMRRLMMTERHRARGAELARAGAVMGWIGTIYGLPLLAALVVVLT